MLEFGGGTGKKKHVEDEEVKEMKRELRKPKKEKSQAHVEQRRFKILKNRIEKIRKRKMKEKVLDVIACRGKEGKRYWVKLKKLGGWRRGGSRIPETVLDDRGIERGSKERSLEGGIPQMIQMIQISIEHLRES